MTKKKNLSEVAPINVPFASMLKIGIVTAAWNPEVTGALRDGAVEYLTGQGILPENIIQAEVPGSFELPLAAQFMLENEEIDGVVCLGCIIQGETRHFEFIANAVAGGIMNSGLNYNAPVSFGVLTTDTEQQARERAGGIHGNKGIEAAAAVLSMLKLKTDLGA